MGSDKPAVRATVTIYDVARECGVAASTVSRALSRPGRVNAETGERVRRVAARLGYRSAPLTRAPATSNSAMLALVVPDVTNPVFFRLVRGAEDAAKALGYTVALSDAQESGRTEREAVERALGLVDGVLLAGARISDATIRHLAVQTPVVVANRAVSGLTSVVIDNAAGIRQSVEHLCSLGHEAVTYVAGPPASWADGTRWQAVQASTQRLGLHTTRLGPYPPTVSGGMGAAGDLLRKDSTAVIAYNDLLAIGILRGLARAKVEVPAQVSLVGFDNIFGSDFCTPALTTVAAPLRELGRRAMAQLIDQVRGAKPRAEAASLPARLVIRDSTSARISPAAGTNSAPGSSAQAIESTSARLR